MKENRLVYEQPVMMDVSDSYTIFTLDVSAEYDAGKETNPPSIDDIIQSQYW